MDILILILSLAACLAAGLPGFVWLLAAVMGTWAAALAIPRHRWVFWAVTVLHALALIAAKLSGLLELQFPLPLGFSYVTLVLIGYCADLFRGKLTPERNLFRFLLCMCYYPRLAMGPLEAYGTLAPAMTRRQKFSWDNLTSGAARMLWGGFKQLVIAARAGAVIGTITADPEHFRGVWALLALVLYSVRLYADFSGGMDLVLGFSRILGISLSENFDRPYFSQSVAEFWRRWHITLGAWLKNYIYIPLGGSRKGTLRKYVNTLVTFLVSGFWHGPQYLLWGLFNGIFVCFGEKLKTRRKLLNQMGTYCLITLLWAFFVWPDSKTALAMLASLFTSFACPLPEGAAAGLGLGLSEWIVFFAGCALLWLGDGFRDRITAFFRRCSPAARTALLCSMALGLLVFGMYGIGFVADDFIYSRF